MAFTFPGASEPLLRDLCLEIGTGEVTAVVGPSGCGKSTLLRLAAGLLEPGKGRVRGADRSDGDVSFVFQQANLLPWRTVADNVGLPLELRGVPPAERTSRVARALAEVGLSDAAELRPHALSGGMRMRASLARAFLLSPRLLLLDEAFSALDAITRRESWERFLATWSAERPTVLMVTHDIDEAVLLADRVVAIGGRPLQVRGDVEVPLPRPRHASMRHDPRLAEAVVEIERWL